MSDDKFCKRGHPFEGNRNLQNQCRPCNAALVQEKRDLKKAGLWKPVMTFGKGFCKRGHTMTPDNTYPGGQCKQCVRARSAKRYEDHPEEILENSKIWVENNPEKSLAIKKDWAEKNPDKVKRARKKHRYSLPPDRLDALILEQDNRCWICKIEFTVWSAMVIDHDHTCCSGYKSCGKCVRGLLCKLCNIGLGGFKDNPDSIRKSLLYLEQHSNKQEKL